MDEEKLLRLATIVGELKRQYKELSFNIESVKKIEGPQGPQGLQGPKGEQGDKGLDGAPGKDGQDGKNGKDGADGRDGVSVVDAYIAADGNLVLKLSDGNEIDCGNAVSKEDAAFFVHSKTNLVNAVDYLDFNTQVPAIPRIPGRMSWNADEETLDVVLNGAILQMGQEVLYHVRNNTASLIANGTPVMATGTLGASGRITIAPMDGTSISNAKFFIGIATEDIPAGDDGKVTHFGKVREIDTRAYAEGTVLWISTTTVGALTATEPTAGMKIPAALVISSKNNGTIMVRVTNGLSLKDIHDVRITSPQNGDVLKYNAAGAYWYNAQP